MANQKFKETEIGLIPIDWDVKRLEEVSIKITDGSHHSPKTVDNGKLIATVKDMNDSGFNYDSCRKISKEEFEKLEKSDCKPKENDVLIAKDGSFLKNVFVATGKEEVIILSSIAIIRPNIELICPKFLMYSFLNPVTKKRVSDNYVSGAVIQRIILKDFKRIHLVFPTINEQKAIAKILSDLDEKIEVNKKINEILEEIGQTLFKRWFIDFEFPNEKGEPYKSSGGEMIESELGEIPIGWEVGNLGNLVQNINETEKSGNHLKDLPYIPTDVIESKKLSLSSFKPYTEAKSSLIKFNEDDILFGAMRVYFHKVCISPFAGITRKTCFVLRPLNQFDLSYCLFLIFNESTIDYANSNSKGSTMPYAVWKSSLEKMKIVIPSVTIRKEFNKILKYPLEKIKKSFFEIQILKQTRDGLLPKLMSGKIRIK